MCVIDSTQSYLHGCRRGGMPTVLVHRADGNLGTEVRTSLTQLSPLGNMSARIVCVVCCVCVCVCACA